MRLTTTQIHLEHAAAARAMPEPMSPEIRARQLGGMLRLLPAEDRRLVDLLLIQGVTQRAAAIELGQPAGVLARRLCRLRNLFACPTRRAIAAHLHTLAEPMRQTAIDYFFSRISVTVMASHRGIARYVMQRDIDIIRGWARALRHDDARTSGDDEPTSPEASHGSPLSSRAALRA